MPKLNKRVTVILVVAAALALFDLSTLDSLVYKHVCLVLGLFGVTAPCPDFYDLPIWEVCVTLGTLSAAYYAAAGIRESNKRLEIEQSPHVVFIDRLFTGGPENLAAHISLKNIGKGRASNITATADPAGKISIIDGSNPHAIDLNAGEHNTSWAVDENRIKEGLKEQAINVHKLIRDIPDENDLYSTDKEKADFKLFLWYEDQLENKYMTQTVFRHSGHFIKVMRNSVRKL